MALSRIFVAPKYGQGGVKKSKKFFFRKNIRKMGKKFGDLWDHFWPKSIWGVRGGGRVGGWVVRSTVTSPGQGSPDGIPPRPGTFHRPVPSRTNFERPVPSGPCPAFVPFKNLYLISEIIL